MPTRIIFITQLLVTIFITNCKTLPNSTDSTETKAGVLIGIDELPKFLINVEPGKKIEICFDPLLRAEIIQSHQKPIKEALELWLSTAGRSEDLIIGDCTNDIGHFRIYVTFKHENDRRHCRDPGLLYEVDHPFLYICREVKETNIEAYVTHEIGHFMGLCDQYKAKKFLWIISYATNNHADNCHSTLRTEHSEPSVMTTNPQAFKNDQLGMTLSNDDIAGVQMLLNLDSYANKIWAKKIEPKYRPYYFAKFNSLHVVEAKHSSLTACLAACDQRTECQGIQMEVQSGLEPSENTCQLVSFAEEPMISLSSYYLAHVWIKNNVKDTIYKNYSIYDDVKISLGRTIKSMRMHSRYDYGLCADSCDANVECRGFTLTDDQICYTFDSITTSPLLTENYKEDFRNNMSVTDFFIK